MSYDDFDEYAELYDVIYDKDEDVDFYVSQAKNVDGKVLEVACGTGRIYLDMLKEGVDAYGIDISEEMLDKLREKADERGLEPRVSKADMQDFELGEKFSLIIIPFRSFLHNFTVDEQVETLDSVYKHLEEDGKLILNSFCPDIDYIREKYGEKQRNEKEKNGETFVIETVNKLADPLNWILEFDRKVLKDGEEVWNATGKLKMVTKSEFELLFRDSSFTEWDVYGGFDLEELENVRQEMVWVARK